MKSSSAVAVAEPHARAALGPSQSAQRVLDAALDLFTRHGFDGTSLQLLADQLGVTKAAIYYHFRTKNEILAALVGPTLFELEELLDRAARQPASRSSREQALTGYVDYLLRHQQVTAFLIGDITALSQPEVWQPAMALSRRVELLLVGDVPGQDVALARLWGAAAQRAMSGALLSAALDAPEAWLRAQLADIGRQMIAGHRRAQREARRSGVPDSA